MFKGHFILNEHHRKSAEHLLYFVQSECFLVYLGVRREGGLLLYVPQYFILDFDGVPISSFVSSLLFWCV